MKNVTLKSLVAGAAILASSSSMAASIETGLLQNSTTAGSPLVTNINATPVATIRFEVGGAAFVVNGGELDVDISVDTSSPAVLVGTAADQSFRDDTNGAAFFGYYLTTGVRSANQTPANVNIKVNAGAGETANRSYYLLGNGTSTPAAVGDLTDAPGSATTFASTSSNSVHCGPSYAANGVSSLGCAGGSTVANMDITQFVRVAYSDPASTPIVSQLEFIAVAE